MPVYTESLVASQDRFLGPKVPPLPRLTPLPSPSPEIERYEVIIVGAGPAGSLCNLLLARSGLPPSSLLCIDSNLDPVKVGHADGLHPRTLEVLKSLDIADEVLNHGYTTLAGTNWRTDPENEENGIVANPGGGGAVPGRPGRMRYRVLFQCYHQGHMLRIMEQDLKKYHTVKGIERGTKLVNVKIDEEADSEFPVAATLENDGKVRHVRAKYLVGADGAHSAVRKLLGIKMEGSSMDDLYGVIDMVADTDFPDHRRTCHITRTGTSAGNLLMIAREKGSQGEYMNRCYVSFAADGVTSSEAGESSVNLSQEAAEVEMNMQARKANVNKESILSRIAELAKPYRFQPKKGIEVEWWAAYQVGQRLAERNAETDSNGHPRILLIGDAFHTHTPKLGQGMNVSFADAIDLSWKLAHVLHGLSPHPTALLETYVHDRRQTADLLINFDKLWYEHRYQQGKEKGAAPNPAIMGQDFRDFLGGIGVEYEEGYLVDAKMSGPNEKGPIISEKYTDGALREGRRFPDAEVTRYIDGATRHLQDEVVIDGKYRVVIFVGEDGLEKDTAERPETRELETVVITALTRYPEGIVDVVLIISPGQDKVELADMPEIVRKTLSMNIFMGTKDMYDAYGVDETKGAVVIVRPDQHIGSIGKFCDGQMVERYLERVLVKRVGDVNGK